MSDREILASSLGELRGRHSSKWRRFPADVLPMHVAEMDFQIAEPIASRIATMVRESDLGYLGPVPEVAESFEKFALARWGWQIHPQRLRMASDVGVATVEFLRANLKPGERVIITSPVYSGFFEWLEELSIEPVDVPLLGEKHELDLAGIEREFQAGHRFLLLCSPHNPLGRVFSRAELTALAALAHKYDAVVISDEIHAPLAFETFTPYLDCGEDAAATGVCITSASKSWNLAGLKAAFLITQSPELNALVNKMPAATHWRTSIIGAFAMAEAYTNGAQWLDATRATLDENRRHTLSELERLLPMVSSHLPEAGYLMWLDVSRLGLTSAEILEKARVAFVPGPDMGGSRYANFARMNIGTSKELITEGLERIQRAL